MEAVAAELGHDVLAWRDVPTDNRSLGASAVKVEPVIQQWFVTADGAKHRQLDAEGQVGRRGGAGRAGGPCGDGGAGRGGAAGAAPEECAQHTLRPHPHKHPPPSPHTLSVRHPAPPQLYVLRKMIEAEWSAAGLGYDDAYFCSLSSKTVIYKGQLTPAQVGVAGGLRFDGGWLPARGRLQITGGLRRRPRAALSCGTF
jgi:hypothetical protein